MQDADSDIPACSGSDTLETVSGRCSRLAEPTMAERFLAVGGGGNTGLIGAVQDPEGAEPPFRSPGPGVEGLLFALAASLHAALTGIDAASPSAAGSCLETMTLVFTDLVGWTGMASRISPEIADEVRRRHFATLERSIAAFGGIEVKKLGDGTMVAFATASRALGCAVEMQREVDRDNLASPHPLGLRIGLSGGEVTREGADFFGDPVVEAARLCAMASGGEILAAQVVKDMAGRRARFPYRSVGHPELKGLPHPFEVFQVHWNPVAVRDARPAASKARPIDSNPSARLDGPVLAAPGRS